MLDLSTLLLRLADFHIGATLLLSVTLVAGYFLGQPARRLTLAWSAAVAIAVLGVLCCVPGWSMLHVFRAEVPQATVALPSDFEKSLSQAATGFQATPTESFQVAPSTSPSSEIIVKSPAASFTFDPTLAAITVGTLGTLLCSVWLIAGALSAKRIIRAAMPAGERLQNLLREVAGEETLPRLLVSDRLSVAAAIGLWRPAILLPVSIDATATDEDLRDLLAHELAHVRNGDLRLLALWRLLLVALWINPLYWLLRRRIRLDQETLADAVAADQTNRQEYAKRLVGWAREMSTGPSHPRLAGAAGLWENPSQLRRRIAVLLDEQFTLLRQCSRRWRAACLLAAGSLAVAASLVTLSPAEPKIDFLPDAEAIVKLVTQQEMLALPVRVVDEEGDPVAGAKVTPWALRSSMGHGWWRKKEGEDVGPTNIVTDADGLAVVEYPRFHKENEKVETTAVSLWVDHLEYAYTDDDVNIDVPIEEAPFTIELVRGVPIELRPTINNQSTELNKIFAIWSDDRSYLPGVQPSKTLRGTLRLPVMKPGIAEIRLVRLEEETATHYSSILTLDLKPGKPVSIDVPLRPAQTIHGVLSENVPRPVRQGRVVVETLPEEMNNTFSGPEWFTWVPIQPDGSFAIKGWPEGEALQLIALCDGFHATSGAAPKVFKLTDPEDYALLRPQVFNPTDGKSIEVAMTSLVSCNIHTVDTESAPLPNIEVGSYPSVCWWNGGSQLYCGRLLRCEHFLKSRDIFKAVDKAFPSPFSNKTNLEGRVVLKLPAGRKYLSIDSDKYEMPIHLGRRYYNIRLAQGETTSVQLTLQPKGTESLGDWDNLAGIVFGCSSREGRRICALPGLNKKMEAFGRRLREADNPRDPALLAEAYEAIAEAFDGVGDAEEAAKWRLKAAGKIEKSDTEIKAASRAVIDEGTDAPDDRVLISGEVTDTKGKAVSDALVLLLQQGPEGELVIKAKSDSEGKYTLQATRARLDTNAPAQITSVWCYSPNRQLGAASAYRQMKGKSKEPINFSLQAATDTGFIVTDTDDKPISDALVEPWHFLLGSYEIVPETIRKAIGTRTDKKGRVLLPEMRREGFLTVHVMTEGYGTQELQLRDSADEPAIRKIQLRPAGRLEGRLITDSKTAIETAKIFVSQRNSRNLAASTTGFAILTVDDQGHFTIPAFAEGPVELNVRIDKALSTRPRIPRKLQVLAGEVTEVKIPFEPTIRIHGRLQTKKGKVPVPGGLVSIQYGNLRQGEHALTDEEGRFEANVLAGSVRQRLIVRPDNYTYWTVKEAGWQNPIQVPSGEASFDLPSLELIETVLHPGSLVDTLDKPIAGVRISAITNNRVYGDTYTREDGGFEHRLPADLKIEEYEVHPGRHRPSVNATIISDTPLRLEIAN